MVHSTNGRIGSTLAQEVNFLRTNSKKSLGLWQSVSAHYLIGKDGTVVEIVDPSKYCAVHTGFTIPGMSNAYSLGIEIHYTPGEGEMTPQQWLSLTLLKRKYNLLTPVMHRKAALPPGRKIDPSCITDAMWDYWVASCHKTEQIITVAKNGNIREHASVNARIVRNLANATNFFVLGDVVSTEDGGTVNNSNRWYYINGVGYVHESIT